jgi:hypothetical protein
MLLPDLPPDLAFALLARDDEALRYSFEVKRLAMGPHIAKRWGWDEALQQKLHRERFDEKPFFRIVRDGKPGGTVSVQRGEDHIRFGEFYLLPDLQRQGAGRAYPAPLPAACRCRGPAGPSGISQMEPGRHALSPARLQGDR